MSDSPTTERAQVTASPSRLGVAVLIGDVVVNIAGPAPAGVMEQTEAQVRSAALRPTGRALEVAQQEIAQEQG